MYLAHDSGWQTFLAIASEMLNGSCRGFSNLCDRLLVQRSLAERLLREVAQVALRTLKYPARTAIFFTNGDKKFGQKKVELIGSYVFNCLDSCSDSQNFFYTFKSLLVLY